MLTIRQLDVNDATLWATLRLEALQQHPLAFGASAPDSIEPLVELARTRLASSEDAVVLGAFDDDAIVGIVGIRRIDGLKERHKTLVWGMFVTARVRGAGVGEALMRRAIEHARTMPDVEQIRLAVSSVATAAQRLYAKLGFREWGREPRALCSGGEYADESHMVLDI